MKAFIKKIILLNVAFVSYAIFNPIFKRFVDYDILPASDIYLMIGAGVFLIATICLVIIEKSQSVKDKIIKSFVALIFFILKLGLSVYLSLVVWTSLDLPY